MVTLEPPLITGNAFTETVTLAEFTQPSVLVPVTVYVLLAVGLAIGFAHVVHDKPDAGDHA